MVEKKHHYAVKVIWTGNEGSGTSDYAAYSRAHSISAEGRLPIDGSSDPSFRGDPSRWNPEQLLVASASACHKLWYLALCAGAGIRVIDYQDDAVGRMVEGASGAGQFEAIILQPRVLIAPGSDIELAKSLHHRANEMCFIARSLNFPIEHRSEITFG